MNRKRIITTFAILLVSVFAFGDSVRDSIQLNRKDLSTKQGEDRINLYGKIYRFSQDTEDFQLQWQCLHDYMREATRQGNLEHETNARAERIVLFYNNVMNDSVYHYAPIDLKFLRENKDWPRYYEVWGLLVNTHVYGGSINQGLQEAEKMYEDAKSRDDKLGLGLSYAAMGNVYFGMNLMDNAAKCYQKGINLMMQQTKKPEQLSELFSLQCELYERIGDYEKLERLTIQWREYIEHLIIENKLSRNDFNLMPTWAYYYIGCAQADMGLGRLGQAELMLHQARQYIPSEEDVNYRLWLYYMAKLAVLEGKYEEALKYSQQQLSLYDGKTDLEDMVRAMSLYAGILTKLGQHSEAADIYNKMYLITDSIHGFEMKKQLAEMNTLLHVDELKVKQSEQQKLSIIIIATIIVLSLAIFLFFRIRSARRLRKAHIQLEDAHDKLLTAYDQLEETTKAKERIESDLRIARDIQMSMVPSRFPDQPDIDLYASMTPAKEVGGDLYGYHLQDDKLYFCLGDVSGKGVPASLFMAQATRLFRTLASQNMKPAEICTRINNALSGEDNEKMMFVTMFVGLVDLPTGHLDFCNAGHNPPIIMNEGKAEFIDMLPNAPIGLWPELDYEGQEIDSIANQPFFVYSDGLNEAENRQQEQFTDERLLEILQTTPFESSQKTIEMLKAEVEKHRDGAEPNDDLTMVCVKIIKENQ